MLCEGRQARLCISGQPGVCGMSRHAGAGTTGGVGRDLLKEGFDKKPKFVCFLPCSSRATIGEYITCCQACLPGTEMHACLDR